MSDSDVTPCKKRNAIISLPTRADDNSAILTTEIDDILLTARTSKTKAGYTPRRIQKYKAFSHSFILNTSESFISSKSLIPISHFKYSAIWQRAYFKIRISKAIEKIYKDVVKFGTSGDLYDHDDKYKHNIEEILNKKLTHNEAFRKAENEVIVELPDYILKPDSRFKQIWKYIYAALCLYTACLMPYRLAFEDCISIDAWTVLEFIVDVLFFIDICIKFFSSYKLPDGNLQISHKAIILKYLRVWFLFDIIACIPFELIIAVNQDNRLSKYRLFKITRLVKVFNAYQKNNLIEKMQDFLDLNSRMVKLINFVITTFVGIHIMGCLWYLAAKYEGLEPDSWVVRYGILDEPTHTLYISSIYWAMVTLSTIGYGDILPRTILEKFIAIIWMIFGVGFYSFTVGSLTSLLYSIDSSDSILNTKLFAIQQFAKEKGLDSTLISKLHKAVRYNSHQNEVSWSNKLDLLENIPQHLKYSLSKRMHHRATHHFTFFQHKSISFISQTITYLKPSHISDGEYIYVIGQHPDEVYFLSKGRANFVVGGSEIVYKSFLKGSYFGEWEVINRLSREDNTKAFGTCEFLVMSSKQFRSILEEYPYEAKQIRKIAAEKAKRTQKAKDELIELLILKIESKDFTMTKSKIRHETIRK